MFKLPDLFNWQIQQPSRPSAPIRQVGKLRRWVVGQRIVPYELKRTSRRTIGFVVDGTGLHVTAPHWVTQAGLESALSVKAEWILSKLDEQLQRAEDRANRPQVWQAGGLLPLLGKHYTLIFHEQARVLVDHAQTMLCLRQPSAHTDHEQSQQIRKQVQTWLKIQARSCFIERLNHYAPRMGVSFKQLSLSSAKTRWGSCTSEGNIRLHWKLIHCDLKIIDYLVVHELAHLREMNHSPRFWQIVAKEIPDYAERRKALKVLSECMPD